MGLRIGGWLIFGIISMVGLTLYTWRVIDVLLMNIVPSTGNRMGGNRPIVESSARESEEKNERKKKKA